MSSVTSHDGDGNTQNSPETSTPSNTSFLEYRDVSEFLKVSVALQIFSLFKKVLLHEFEGKTTTLIEWFVRAK